MNFKNESELIDIGKKAKLDWEVRENEFYIYNFIINKELRNENIGSEVMETIINFCELNNIAKVVAHIDLTHRKEDGYPEDKNIHEDPTIHFLRHFNFYIVDYGPNKTVLGKLKID